MIFTKAKPEEAHNCVKQAEAEPGRCRYLFVDSAEHHGDRILVGSLIPVKFFPLQAGDTRNRTLAAEGDGEAPFELRLCSFEARYESWFLCCMADLEWVLKVEGDYLEACEQLLGAPAVIQAARSELARQGGGSRPFSVAPGLTRLRLQAAEA